MEDDQLRLRIAALGGAVPASLPGTGSVTQRLSWIAARASSTMGREVIVSTEPIDDDEQIGRRLRPVLETMDLIAFGELLWDVFDDKRLIGGAPFNVATHAARLGIETALVSAVGADALLVTEDFDFHRLAGLELLP